MNVGMCVGVGVGVNVSMGVGVGVTTNHGTSFSMDCKYERWFLPPFSASTRPAVLAFPPAAAVCASAVKEVALDVRVLPEVPPYRCV